MLKHWSLHLYTSQEIYTVPIYLKNNLLYTTVLLKYLKSS